MPILAEYAIPKGNAGMMLVGTNNNDSTITLPAMQFTVKYGGASVTTLYTNGNTWVGFGAAAEHLAINRRDTSYNKLFYAHETECGKKTFRIRFEGNSTYSSYGTNNLIWEFTVFEDGVFMLVVEKTPNNAADSFNAQGAAVTVKFETAKSYVFMPGQPNGTQFTVTEGNYLPYESRFLMEDSEGVKSFIDGAWAVVAEPPITAETMRTHGIQLLPNNLTGLLDSAKLFYYNDNFEIVDAKENYHIEAKLVVTSNPQVILQTEDFALETGRAIASIEVRSNVIGGRIRIAMSVDGGAIFLTYNLETQAFGSVDIGNHSEFLACGIAPSSLPILDYNALNAMASGTLRFAYILEKTSLPDICKLKAVKITYATI